MILVYEHAPRGSLDHYLNSSHLKWSQRIKICLDAAKGLSYLHDPGETHQRLIHCDIKSGNILLDDQWNAKLSDLGLSIMGSANENQSLIVTLAAGTLGYIDPQYMMTRTLTKESDVYSFGVVLFEVLCGKLCYMCSDGRPRKILVPTWIESYEKKKLNDCIYKSLTVQPLDQSTLKIFSDIAYRCLNESREDRPKMSEVVTELETALESQEVSEKMQFFDYEELTKSAKPPLNYGSKVELWKLLLRGVLLNGGKTWLSLNKKGEHCELISFVECLVSAGPCEVKPASDSRFDARAVYLNGGENYKVHVKTHFLSTGITYTMNLICRFNESAAHLGWVSLKYKLEGETDYSRYTVFLSDDGDWLMCELYQFTSDQRDHEILFQFMVPYQLKVEGIEFRPLEEVENRTEEKQPVSDSDANWEEKLPTDYEDIIKRSTDSMHWTTKKEAYSILRKGFLIDDGREWFSLDKYGMKCLMLSAVDALVTVNGSFLSLPDSRFGEVYESSYQIPDIRCDIQLELLSSQTAYDAYLVHEIPKGLESYRPVPVYDQFGNDRRQYILLECPETPVIRPKAHQTHNPTNRLPNIRGIPRQRVDGWMEVQIWKFRTTTTKSMIRMCLKFMEVTKGIIIQGIELRPT